MSNKSMVKRMCRGGKSCNNCEKEIEDGADYWSGPYKSLCLDCYEQEKTVDSVEKSISDDSYVISGSCSYCQLPAIGMLWGKKVCAADINQALTENI